MPWQRKGATDDDGKDGRLPDHGIAGAIEAAQGAAGHSAGLDRERQAPKGLDLVQAAMTWCEGCAGTSADR